MSVLGRATYIWLSGKDAHHDIRGKDRTMRLPASCLDTLPELSVFPEWNFDGSSTAQALSTDTEIIVRPVRVFPCPLPNEGLPWWVVLCDTYNPDGTPALGNTRVLAKQVFAANPEDAPWFGMEQEYILRCDDRPFGWPEKGTPPPQGPYYCSTGPLVALGRRIVERHYELSLKMGLLLSGINGEVFPGQWEFQVGPCEGIEAGDHMIAARWLFLRILELEGHSNIDIDYGAKPVAGDWNGSGMHVNFSTAPMRVEGGAGMSEIEKAIERLSKTVAKDILVYGKDNNIRLTGAHETSRHDAFTHGVGTRTTSIRIPNSVKKAGGGYLEDRRPAADVDPYLVTARLYASATGVTVGAFDDYTEGLRQPWMVKP